MLCDRFPDTGDRRCKGTIVIPHLGASTEESEDNCAKMAAEEIRDFIENGNITHSVNFPDCALGEKGESPRITILHKNIPNMAGGSLPLCWLTMGSISN